MDEEKKFNEEMVKLQKELDQLESGKFHFRILPSTTANFASNLQTSVRTGKLAITLSMREWSPLYFKSLK